MFDLKCRALSQHIRFLPVKLRIHVHVQVHAHVHVFIRAPSTFIQHGLDMGMDLGTDIDLGTDMDMLKKRSALAL
jgi:hypothetical protein